MLPAIVVASQAAHGAAYWWAYPQASLRFRELSLSGHGYLAYALFTVAGLHALAALWHQLMRRDGLLSRMWPGKAGSA